MIHTNITLNRIASVSCQYVLYICRSSTVSKLYSGISISMSHIANWRKCDVHGGGCGVYMSSGAVCDIGRGGVGCARAESAGKAREERIKVEKMIAAAAAATRGKERGESVF